MIADVTAYANIEMYDFLSRFIAQQSELVAVAHTLWVRYWWFRQHRSSTPRIVFLSPERGSAKSCALAVTGPLVPRPVSVVNATLCSKVSDEARQRAAAEMAEAIRS